MNDIDKIRRVTHLQNRLRQAGAILIPFFTGLGLSALWSVGGLMWWVVFAFICLVLSGIWNALSVGIVAGLLIAELSGESPNAAETELEIVDVGGIIGSYKGANLFSWIKMRDSTGTVRMAEFDSTTSPDLLIVPGCIVLPPGIAYRFTQVDEFNIAK